MSDKRSCPINHVKRPSTVVGGLSNKQTSLRAGLFRSSAGRFLFINSQTASHKKFLEKYKIFFVPNHKIPHINNVGPLLSIRASSNPIHETGYMRICWYYDTTHQQPRCYAIINFWYPVLSKRSVTIRGTKSL